MYDIEKLLQQQRDEVVLWHKEIFQSSPQATFLSLVSQQNYKNFELWHQEDLARDPEASDSNIAGVKRQKLKILN